MALEIDTRINEGIGDVAQQGHDQPHQREGVERAEDDRIVPVDDALEPEPADAVETEEHLDEEGAGEKHSDEGGREPGNDDQHRVAEHVAVEHPVLRQSLGPRGLHILQVDLVQERVLGQHRQVGKGAHSQRRHRQRDVPEIIDHLFVPGQVGEVLRHQAAQRENLPVRPARKEHDQQHREQEGRDGIADDDDGRGPDVEARTVRHRLADAQRNRDQIGDQECPDAERDRHRHLVEHQADHGLVAEIALPEIEHQIVADHLQEPFMQWLVEAELGLKLLDEFRVQSLGTAIAAVLNAGSRLSTTRNLATPRTRQPRARTDRCPLDLSDHLLHGSAGGELDDGEIDQQDHEQGRDHQQQATDDIGDHG